MTVTGVSNSANSTALASVYSVRKLPFLSLSESLPCPKISRKPASPTPLRCRWTSRSDSLCGKFRVHASNAGVGSGSEEDGSQSSSLDRSHATSSESLKPQGPFPYSLSIALVLLACGLVFSLITFVKGGPSSVLAAVAKSGFTAAFSLIFVSEIGDKTFFIAALLAMQYEKTLVLLGSMGALSLMTILSVVIGKVFQSVPAQFQTTLPIGEYAAIALLMFFGLKSIKDAWDLPQAEAKNGEESGIELGEYTEAEELVKEKASKKLTNPLEILWKSFSLVFFAEWGDRSMLATVALGAAQSPWGVASGAIAGHLVATLLAIMGGAFLANYISEKLVGYVGGALFLVFAAATFFGVLFDSPALKVALCQPLDAFRLYLSKATLIVVPANLVDHWKTQIGKHVSPGQLRILVWTDNKKLSPHNLAWDYDVVITTFSRLSAEWNPRKKSPLIQVHWLRVMLDEGHTLGSSLSLTNKFQMAVSLTASSRWLLTGTPTPNTPNSQLSHLQPLLKFLHEEVYGDNLKYWEAGILRPFEAEIEEGRSRLLQLLQRCMICSRKKDLRTIPPCIKKSTYLNFVPRHARSYNELVESVRRNILLADWNDPSHVESLLNSKQWKFRNATVNNVRLSCCVAGHIKMTDAGQDIKETMDALVEGGLDDSTLEYSSIQNCLISGCNCKRCGEWCRLPVITPCRHLLCLDCVSLDSERCTFPGCGYLYEMQTLLARPENPNPKWPVPKDLIELQPSYNQDDWNPDWQSTSSSKVSYLVDRLKKLHEGNRKSILSFNKSSCDNLEENIPGTSKAFLGQDLRSQMVLVDKVLIFSQFLEHIHVIEQQLEIAGIKFAGMYSPMPSSKKMKNLTMFQNDADCMALLMDGSAALGLDLSFVTHVFLMEPIWDKSMEEQVISRAHRMGAKRPIYVETLTMRGTIEEQMMRFLEDAEKSDRLSSGDYIKVEQETTRSSRRTIHDLAESNYLSHLIFVRSEGNT